MASKERLLEVAVEVLVLVMAMAQLVVGVLTEEAQTMLLGALLAHLLVPQLEPELVLDLGLKWLVVKTRVGGVEVVGTQVMAEVKEVVMAVLSELLEVAVEVLQELLEVVVEILQELLEVVLELLPELLRVTVQLVKMVQGLQQKEKAEVRVKAVVQVEQT